jgi:ribosomal protein S18 acetylase RimI-like enzyme
MHQLTDKQYDEYQRLCYAREHGYILTPDNLRFICEANEKDPERIGEQILQIMGRMQNDRIAHMTSDKRKNYVIRCLRKGETELLKDFLYEAIFVPKGMEPPDRDIIEKPELRVYTDDFGTRKGDNCLVADFSGKVVGAVWTRIMDDYGHVDDDTPSFAISLYKEYRKQGIGSQLMVKMLEMLKWQGYERASLAVQKENYAVKMYEDVGFKTIKENDEEYIMVCEL